VPNAIGLQWEGVRRLQGVGRKGVEDWIEGGLSEGKMMEKEEKEEEKKGWRGCGWHFVRRKCPMEEAVGYRVRREILTRLRLNDFGVRVGLFRRLWDTDP
jgi:hypothetical protein